MAEQPLAYHITFGTYGTRLHGDERGTVVRRHNQPKEPILGRDAARQRMERSLLRFKPVVLSIRQRHHAEVVIPEICCRGGWQYHLATAQPDHIHILLTAEAEGKVVRRLLKRWLSEELSKFWRLAESQPWWADSGSVKWIWDDNYFRNVFKYIEDQCTLRSE